MNRVKNIQGQVFHDTCKAIKFIRSDNGNAVWLFECLYGGFNCEKTFEALAKNVKKGDTRSCGCLNRERVSKARTKHGASKTPEYYTYRDIHNRCYNKTCSAYYYYGARGIKVCWRWHRDNPDGFKNFLADMGYRPSPDHTLERVNNDGDYSPDNCVWLINKQQPRNRRYNVIKDLEEAEFIRDLHKLGYSTNDIANGLNAKDRCIYDVITKRTWKI